MMALDPDAGYRLHPQVALRPEPFGALAYHYGNRKLVFLKTPQMVSLVKDLGAHATVSDALDAAGIPAPKHAKYLTALADLERSEIIHAVG